MEEIKITELHESTIESIKKTSEFFVYEEGCCHRNSLEIYTGDIIDSLFSKIGYTITSRSIVEGFAVVIDDNIVFPHIWNAFSISKDDVVSTEYIDISKSLFFNEKIVRYFKIKNYDVDTLERNNENGSVFSIETKEIAKQFASENDLKYKELQEA
jgi:hypothetical protein